MKAKTEEILIIGIAFALLIATVFITDPNIFGYVVYSPENYTYEPSLIEYNNGYKLIKQNLSNLEITSLNPSNYETAFLKVNDKYYVDRGYKIETIPEDLQNLLWIKTANNDKNTQNLNFNFNVNYPVRIYIGYDKRLEPPSWLSSWNYYGTGIETKDESSNPYNIYYKNFQQGNIQLGDNCETDCTSGSKSMYLVLIDTTYPSSASLISEEIQPKNLSKWDLLEKQETLNSQTIDYYYSTDSGNNWNKIKNFNLSFINSTKLKFKVVLNSDGMNTPILHSLSINYNEIKKQVAKELIGYWKFDEGSGTITKDSSNNSNNGIINNAKWVEGKKGYALQFQNLGDSVIIKNNDKLNPTNSFTYMLWVKFNKLTPYDYMIDHGYTGKFLFYTSSVGNKPQVWANIDGTKKIQVPKIIETEQWYHFAITYDGSSLKLYQNGELADSIPVTGSLSTTNNDLYFGRYSGKTGYELNGTLDEIKIYNYALTSEEIQQEYEPCTENWNCTSWSSCINNTQYRNCTDLNNCNTTLNKPLEIQNCTLENNCTENWNCTSWSPCINNTQTRICNDLNNCNTTLNKPLETQNCTSEENPEGSGGSSSGGGGSSAPNTVYQSSVKIPVTIKTKPLETKKQQKTIPLYESQEPKQESPITGSIVIEKKPKRYFINIILFSIFVVVCYLFYKKLIREK